MTLPDRITRLRKMLEEWKKRADRATPGPWRACSCRKCGQVASISADEMVIRCEHDCEDAPSPTLAEACWNADFVAGSRSEHPKMCEALLCVLGNLTEAEEEPQCPEMEVFIHNLTIEIENTLLKDSFVSNEQEEEG